MISRIGAVFLLLFACLDAHAQREKAIVTTEPVLKLEDGRVIEVNLDFPKDKFVKNISRAGKGCCVFASMQDDAIWHNCAPLMNILDHIEEGGGWPEKVEKVVQQWGQGVEVAQYEGTDASWIDMAMRCYRGVCITYGFSERYGTPTIYHMVWLCHFDSEWACVADNNFPGTYEWTRREEFLRRAKHPQGNFWCFILLQPPPPPIPRNEGVQKHVRADILDDRSPVSVLRR